VARNECSCHTLPVSFLLRMAVQADSPEIARVIKAVYDEYGFTWDEEDYHADLFDLDRYYFSQGHLFWIAEDHEGRAIGTVALELFERVPGEAGEVVEADGERRLAGADCALQRLYVHPEARRSGVGSELLNTVIEEARLRGRELMEIWSDKRFEGAHRLYERLGAINVGDRICHDPDQSPEWGLILKLKEPAPIGAGSELLEKTGD
jgi:putative acetyltransferase